MGTDKPGGQPNPLEFGTERPAWQWLGGLFLLTLLMFGDVLFDGGTRVVGGETRDLFVQFLGWRGFGFRELAHGNFPLWNPHNLSGAPYFGGFQAALLYPPNAIYLILPLAQAVNWGIALHVFMMGAFMFAWMRLRRLRGEAAFLAGALMMFGGTYFPHIYAGHLPNLCAMVWAPLIFLAIDGVLSGASQGSGLDTRRARWPLLGMFAVAMQIFAGHPQYVFYTGLAAGLYAGLRLLDAERPIQAAALLSSIYIGGALLASVQLLAGLQANAETIRNQPLLFQFAAMFGFPQENLLTLIAPQFFGAMSPAHPYWGRCYPWEMSVFLGVTGSTLAIYGAATAEKRTRRTLLAMVGTLAVLALGVHTPLFRVLYDFAPGFDRFRGTSKFMFPASLFLAALAAHGLDRLWRDRGVRRSALVGVCAVAGVFLAAAIFIRAADWRPVIHAMQASRESYLRPADAGDPRFVERARAGASNALVLAAATLGALGAIGFGARRAPVFLYAVLALAILEVFSFARGSRDTFDSAAAVMPDMRRFLAEHPGDYRVFDLWAPGSALSLGAQDIWGDDPGIVRRYAEFITWTQGGDPARATAYVAFRKLDPLYALLRLRCAVAREQDGSRVIVDAPSPPLPHVQLVSRVRVIGERDRIFAAMREPGFDPRKEVILETVPVPAPGGGETPGTVRVTGSSTDSLEVEAATTKPAILLVTDLYTPAWRAVGLPGSAQSSYALQPADYILRAVPLSAGQHHLRIEYAPRAYAVGKWISVFSWLGFGFVALRGLRRNALMARL
ncbi:MAG: hypothetical protein NTX64_07245 [Elusimicrobia bacterium]|nr:hypothetical protein [Elusimicrobiota bacterium]